MSTSEAYRAYSDALRAATGRREMNVLALHWGSRCRSPRQTSPFGTAFHPVTVIEILLGSAAPCRRVSYPAARHRPFPASGLAGCCSASRCPSRALPDPGHPRHAPPRHSACRRTAPRLRSSPPPGGRPRDSREPVSRPVGRSPTTAVGARPKHAERIQPVARRVDVLVPRADLLRRRGRALGYRARCALCLQRDGSPLQSNARPTPTQTQASASPGLGYPGISHARLWGCSRSGTASRRLGSIVVGERRESCRGVLNRASFSRQ